MADTTPVTGTPAPADSRPQREAPPVSYANADVQNLLERSRRGLSRQAYLARGNPLQTMMLNQLTTIRQEPAVVVGRMPMGGAGDGRTEAAKVPVMRGRRCTVVGHCLNRAVAPAEEQQVQTVRSFIARVLYFAMCRHAESIDWSQECTVAYMVNALGLSGDEVSRRLLPVGHYMEAVEVPVPDTERLHTAELDGFPILPAQTSMLGRPMTPRTPTASGDPPSAPATTCSIECRASVTAILQPYVPAADLVAIVSEALDDLDTNMQGLNRISQIDLLMFVQSDSKDAKPSTYNRYMRIRAVATYSSSTLEVARTIDENDTLASMFVAFEISQASRSMSKAKGGFRECLLKHTQELTRNVDARLSEAASMVMDIVIPYSDMSAFVLATQYCIALCPECLWMATIQDELASIASFKAAFSEGSSTPPSLLPFAGYLSLRQARDVSFQNLSTLASAGWRIACSIDVRWRDLEQSDKYVPQSGTVRYNVMNELVELGLYYASNMAESAEFGRADVVTAEARVSDLRQAVDASLSAPQT